MKQIKIPIRFQYEFFPTEASIKGAFEKYIESEEFISSLKNNSVDLMFGGAIKSQTPFLILRHTDWLGNVTDISYDENDVLMATIDLWEHYAKDEAMLEILEHATNAVPVMVLNYVDNRFTVIGIRALQVSAIVSGQTCSTAQQFYSAKFSNILTYSEPVRIYKNGGVKT